MIEYSEPVEFIDLRAQHHRIREQIQAAIAGVLDHGQYIMGPEVAELERRLTMFSGAKYSLTCANGTDALSLVLMSWGVGAGDAVFVPAFTYVATAEAPAQLGATPFFVDVCEETFNIDPISLKQAVIDCRSIGLKPAAVVAVDLFGRPADFESINEIAKEERLKLLIDGAQSFGGTYHGRMVGTMGDATTTSFFPAKPLGCYGDGGAIFTSSAEQYELLNSIRLHGRGSDKYDSVRVGMNSRLDTIQAAILIEKLKIFRNEIELRQRVAQKYTDLLEGSVRTPVIKKGLSSTWAQYTVILKDRDRVREVLKESGIPTGIYYPKPLPLQAGYKEFPTVSLGTIVSEMLSKSVLSLPMHPYLSFKSQQHIAYELLQATGKS